MARSRPRKSDAAALKFAGGRFEGNGFPLDAIDELEKYQRLIVFAAEKLWRERNPNELRLPARFSDRVRLRLTRLDHGSVVPTLERDLQLDLGSTDLLQESINYVDETFREIVASYHVPEDMPEEMLSVIRLFGVSFRDDERATFRWGSDSTIRYGQDTRKAFLAALAARRKVAPGALVGRIRMLDNTRKFIFKDAFDRAIEGSFSDAKIFDEFHLVHQYKQDADLVWLTGDFVLDSDDGSIRKIDDVHSVGLFASGANRWGTPLAELSTYPDGWLEGDGVRITIESLIATLGLLDSVSSEALQQPSVFADADGGVRIEWLDRESHTSLTIGNDASFFGYHLNISDGEEVVLDSVSNASAALDFIRRQRA